MVYFPKNVSNKIQSACYVAIIQNIISRMTYT